DSQGVGIGSPGPGAVQVVLKEDMRPGDTADIPNSVGVIGAQINEGFQGAAVIVLLFQKEETRVNAMRAGFEAFFGELKPAILDNNNLADLATGDDATRQAAIDRIKALVEAPITNAIHDHMGTADKLLRPHDSLIGSGFQFLDLRSQFFSVLISTGGAGPPDEYRVEGVFDTGSWAARPVVSWAPNRLDIFGLGVDNDMFHKWWDGTSWPADWEWLGGIFNSPPAAVSWGFGRLDIFGLGVDNTMFHKWWDPTWRAPDGTNWGPSLTDWQSLGDTVGFKSPPAAVSWGPNRLDVFGVGIGSVDTSQTITMFHKWWDSTNWGPSPADWEWLGGIFNSPPAAVSWGFGRLDIFGLGVDNTTFHKWWDPTWTAPDGTNWGPSLTDWQSLGDTKFNSPPAAV